MSREEISAIREFQPAGFILFSRNIETLEQVRELTKELRTLSLHDPVIAIDQEGGRVVRTSALGLELPSAEALSRVSSTEPVVELAEMIAGCLKYLGVNTDFAPVLDIAREQPVTNSLTGRCWGKTPGDVVNKASVFNTVLNKRGISSCAKHFPGMGPTTCDPHMDLPFVDLTEEELMEQGIAPFLMMIPDLPSIMAAHMMLPKIDREYPATLSRQVIRRILRDRLKYNGVVFTDDLCMGAISRHYGVAEAAYLALKAGCDLPLICHGSLDYVEQFASIFHHGDTDGYEAKDRERRIGKFLKKLVPPLDVSCGDWKSLIDRSRELLKKYPETTSQEQESPVARY